VLLGDSLWRDIYGQSTVREADNLKPVPLLVSAAGARCWHSTLGEPDAAAAGEGDVTDREMVLAELVVVNLCCSLYHVCMFFPIVLVPLFLLHVI
jgi:hypothetical protein